MPERKKRRPVDHKHPVIAAAIHVLKAAGGGPLSAKLIFDRAFDRGLLAATAYNTLRGRLSQHQSVAQVVVRKTSVGYMLTLEGIPEDTPERACAPSRPPPPEDPLAVIPTPHRKPFAYFSGHDHSTQPIIRIVVLVREQGLSLQTERVVVGSLHQLLNVGRRRRKLQVF